MTNNMGYKHFPLLEYEPDQLFSRVNNSGLAAHNPPGIETVPMSIKAVKK